MGFLGIRKMKRWLGIGNDVRGSFRGVSRRLKFLKIPRSINELTGTCIPVLKCCQSILLCVLHRPIGGSFFCFSHQLLIHYSSPHSSDSAPSLSFVNRTSQSLIIWELSNSHHTPPCLSPVFVYFFKSKKEKKRRRPCHWRIFLCLPTSIQFFPVWSTARFFFFCVFHDPVTAHVSSLGGSKSVIKQCLCAIYVDGGGAGMKKSGWARRQYTRTSARDEKACLLCVRLETR